MNLVYKVAKHIFGIRFLMTGISPYIKSRATMGYVYIVRHSLIQLPSNLINCNGNGTSNLVKY